MDISGCVQEILSVCRDLRHDELHASGDHNGYFGSLDAAVIRRAADLHERICAAGQAEALNDWLNSAEVERCETAEYRAVWGFLLLCEVLGERGIAPFDAGKLQRFPPPPKLLDWSMLPAEYHYLVPAAEKYGRIRFHDQIDCFIKYATDADLAMLSQVARRSEDDIHELVRWIRHHGLEGRPEVDLVDFMLILLHEIGLT